MLRASIDTVRAVVESDVVLVCVGIPIGEDLKPDYVDLLNACHEVGKGLRSSDLMILKSTVSPGTIEDIVGPVHSPRS